MADPTISVLVPTGRPSMGSLIGLDEHLFLRTLKSLEAQTFRSFELVVADACAHRRDLAAEIRALGPWSFPWRVVPVGGPWLKKGRPAIQRTINTAATFADGRFFLISGDAVEYPPHVLGECEGWFRKGLQPHLLSVYYRAGARILVTPETEHLPFGHGDDATAGLTIRQMQEKGTFGQVVRDSRWRFVEDRGGVILDAPWTWFHNHGSLSRDDFFALNGADENFDGSKSLQDVEIGSRLELAGRWRPVFTEELYAIDHAHEGWDEAVFWNKVGAPRSNYILLQHTRTLRRVRANEHKLTDEEIRQIIADGATSPEDRVPLYAKGTPEAELQGYWRKNQAVIPYKTIWTIRRKNEGKGAV